MKIDFINDFFWSKSIKKRPNANTNKDSFYIPDVHSNREGGNAIIKNNGMAGMGTLSLKNKKVINEPIKLKQVKKIKWNK